jgi:hypothetical protein
MGMLEPGDQLPTAQQVVAGLAINPDSARSSRARRRRPTRPRRTAACQAHGDCLPLATSFMNKLGGLGYFAPGDTFLTGIPA